MEVETMLDYYYMAIATFYAAAFGIGLLVVTISIASRSIQMARKIRKTYLDQLEEQFHLASMELHDRMSTSALDLERKIINNNSLDQPSKLEMVDALSNLRRDISIANESIYPRSLMSDSFEGTLEDFTSQLLQVNSEIEMSSDFIEDLDNMEKVHLFRVIQEVLLNAYKYEQASNISIYVNDGKKSIIVNLLYKSIPNLAHHGGQHIKKGSHVIQSRLKRINGSINFKSLPNSYKAIKITVAVQ